MSFPFEVLRVMSPNYAFRGRHSVDKIITHCTDGPTAEGALRWFQNPESKVSAHFVIGKDGTIFQCVDLTMAAWHCAGFNSSSIGIEVVALASEKMTPAQDKSLTTLIGFLLDLYGLSYKCITGHRFMAEGIHKSCPGHIFGDATWAALDVWREKFAKEFP